MRKQLRKAGEALLDMDEAYSRKVGDLYKGKDGNLREFSNPAASTAAATVGMFGGSTSIRDAIKGDNFDKAAAATGVAAKYAAPVAGISLAGQALMDFASSQQTDSTLMI